MSHREWDARYRDSADGLWSGRVNGVLVAELGARPPGRALDVGCGEGADAIWLATGGWEVTGLDVSAVALARAAEHATAAAVVVDWVCADLATAAVAPGGYELVIAMYPALRHSPDDAAARALTGAVAADGTLLVVGHAPLDPEFTRRHGFEVSDFIQPSDVCARLDDGWVIETDETRPRVDPVHEGSPFTHDAVLRARRTRPA